MGRMDGRAGAWIEFPITRQAGVLRVTDPRAGDWEENFKLQNPLFRETSMGPMGPMGRIGRMGAMGTCSETRHLVSYEIRDARHGLDAGRSHGGMLRRSRSAGPHSGRGENKCGARRERRQGPDYSHSMVPGGLLVMSRTQRLTPLTSLMMRLASFSRSS